MRGLGSPIPWVENGIQSGGGFYGLGGEGPAQLDGNSFTLNFFENEIAAKLHFPDPLSICGEPSHQNLADDLKGIADRLTMRKGAGPNDTPLHSEHPGRILP